MKHERLFRDASIGTVIIKTSFPAVATILVMMIYNMADMFFIGQSGDAMQIAALSLAGPLMAVLSGAGTLIGSGGCAAISGAFGRKDYHLARSMSSFCCWASVILGTLFMAVVWVFMTPLLHLIGASANTVGYTQTYLSIVVAGAPAMIFSSSMANVVRGEGAMKESMLGNMLGTITNLILDPIFISVFGLGVAGAAIATVIGNLTGAAYYIWYLSGKRSMLSLHPKFFTLRRSVSLKIISLGLPTAFGVFLTSVSSVVRNNYAAGFGDKVVAAMGAAGMTAMIVSMLLMGVALGVQPVIGYTFAAKLYPRMKAVVKRTALVLILLGAALTCLVLFGRDTLVGLFVHEEAVVSLAKRIVLISMVTGPICGLPQLVTTFLQATDKAFWATAAAILRQGVFLIPLTIGAVILFGLDGLLWSPVVADILSTGVAGALFFIRYRQISVSGRHCAKPEIGCVQELQTVYGKPTSPKTRNEGANTMKKQAFNPYLPSYEYIPDAEPYVFGDRVYIYGSHDRFNGKEFCENDYVCWSAPVNGLGDWRYEGMIYGRTTDPLNKDGKQTMCAPDVQKGPDGRYYLYYALNRNTIISVAVCDEPAGNYQFYGHVRCPDGHVFGTKAGEINNFGPGVFMDDDGRIFLYTGFAPTGAMAAILKMRNRRIDGSYCVELEPDMLTVKGEPVLVAPGPELARNSSFAGHAFFEASSLRKINGRYYFIYSSILSHELCYAVSDRPDGDFVYGGTLVSIGDIGLHGATEPVNYTGNTHGSMVEINNQWYAFYHRQTNCHEYSRQACAEPVEIRADGSVSQAEITSCGLNGGPLQGTGTYEARIACNLASAKGACESKFKKSGKRPYFTQSGGDREENADQYIANMRDGVWAGFKYFDLCAPGRITATLRGTAVGVLEVRTERGGKPVAAIPVTPAANWTDAASDFHAPTGKQALYFTFQGTGALDFYAFTLQPTQDNNQNPNKEGES